MKKVYRGLRRAFVVHKNRDLEGNTFSRGTWSCIYATDVITTWGGSFSVDSWTDSIVIKITKKKEREKSKVQRKKSAKKRKHEEKEREKQSAKKKESEKCKSAKNKENKKEKRRA